ncbi:MAG: sigma-54 dependent transcriptional regulator [Bacteroidales bacterium]|jgi:DNA-binding NtrC family response regulator|nr:sigma-54 dependent transcriptional regulator [Bacteroidales bacterium]
MASKSGHILVVDDNKNVISALKILFSSHFEKVTIIYNPNQILEKLRESPDVVLLDMNFSAGINTGNEGLFWLSEIKKYDPELPVVLFTAYADIDLAIRALKDGASDFVVKPWENAKLIATLKSALSLRQSRKEIKKLKETQNVLNHELSKEPGICRGKSAVMQELFRIVDKVAGTDANILITGENGTGKELIAREIHRFSKRNNQVLLTVDMGAITETLFESELFGYVKGAFTDAKTDRAGKFEAADKGTIFLDEIGNLSYPLQAKLLSVLQSRQITRVGSVNPIPIDIRLISATNKDLNKSVENKEFREDLLYRLNTITIEVPPLRVRKEDIPELAEFFLEKYSRKYRKTSLYLSKNNIKELMEYSWPGNVRELQHLIEKSVILSEKETLDITDFLKRGNNRTEPLENNAVTLEDAEKKLIINSLKRHNGNMSNVATELGITRPTLYNKVRKYGLLDE